MPWRRPGALSSPEAAAVNVQHGDPTMALQQNKVSKMKRRIRKAPERYKGIQTSKCGSCGAAKLPHRVCPKCGTYNGRQVVTTTSE